MKRDCYDEYQNKWDVAKGGTTMQHALDFVHDYCVTRPESSGKRKLDIVWHGETFPGQTFHHYCQIKRRLLRAYLGVHEGTARFCELGCGIGHNLQALSKMGEVYGGEYTQAGIDVAQGFGLDVVKFDFYDADTYNIIRPGSIVFTVHAIEQVDDAHMVIDMLRRHKHNIKMVWHLEPCDCGHIDQRNYLQQHGYNTNLREAIWSSPDVAVCDEKLQALGYHPLNPGHILAWKFRQ